METHCAVVLADMIDFECGLFIAMLGVTSFRKWLGDEAFMGP